MSCISWYKSWHRLRDELGNEVEIRDTSIDPEKDIWRWLVYAISTNKEGYEELKLIGNSDGTLLATALVTVAGHFKMLRENWIEAQAKNKYSLDWSRFTEVEQQILAKFKALYELARISPKHQLLTGAASVDNYIIRQAKTQVRDVLSLRVYVYPSGVVNVKCNLSTGLEQDFNLTILDPAILSAYYLCVLRYAKMRLPRGEKLPVTLNMATFHNLVKQRKLENGESK